MTTVTSNNTTTPSGAASSSKPSAAKTSSISSDYQMFLKLLTTQMTNQDPSSPMDSADYAVQLATFSQVEQQVKTNDLLTSLATQMGP